MSSSSSPPVSGGGSRRGGGPPVWAVVLTLLVLTARFTEAAQNLRHILADSDQNEKPSAATDIAVDDAIDDDVPKSNEIVEDTADPAAVSSSIDKTVANNLRRLAGEQSTTDDRDPNDEVEPDFGYWLTPIAALGLTCGGTNIKSRDGQYVCIKAGEALCQDNDGGPFGRWTFGIIEENGRSTVNLWTPKNEVAWTFCTDVTHVCIGEERDPRPNKFSNERPYLYFYDEKTQRTVGNLTCDGTDGFNGENLGKPTILKMVDNSDIGMYANYNVTVLKFKKGQTPDPGDSNELFNITVDRVGQDMVGLMSFKDSKCTWTDTCPAPPNATNNVINLNTPSVGGTMSLATLLPNAFNPINGPLRFILSSPSGVDTTTFDEVSELIINAIPVDSGLISIDQNGRSITVQQDLSSGLNTIYLKAFDDAGRPLYFEESIWAGDMDFTVEVLDRQTGQTVTEPVDIKIFLAEAQHVSVVSTSTSGSATYSNIPDRTIIIEATSESGLTGSSGGAPSSGVITVNLGGIFPLSTEKNLDFEDGLSGWENEGDAGAAAIVPHVETRRKLGTSSGNNDLELRTIGEGEQYVHHQFMPAQGVTNVRLRYRFQTDEVPGGYFGSQYNDYFSVRISSDDKFVGESNCMNGLGLSAFRLGGFTEWREANLALSGSDSVIQVDAVVANVADGEFDAKVVVDFIEEESHEVKPFHLAWDSGNGGILVDYEVLGQGPLAVSTNIQLYWSTGERLVDVIGEPFGSINVPAGTNPGWHGGSNVQVTTLAPDSVTHVVAVSGSAIKALPDVVVRGGRNANLNVVTPLMFSIIKGGLRAAGQSIAEISSTARTPEDQARAMFNNLVETGVARQLNIYRDPGDAVIRVYERLTSGLSKSQIIAMSGSIQSQMTAEINNQGPSNVSRHCGDPAKLCVVDVGAALLPANSRFADFVSQLIKDYPGGNYIDERDDNGCYHLELGSVGVSTNPTVFPPYLTRDSRQGICINKNECLSMTGKEPVPNPFNDPTPNCYKYVADVQCCVDRVEPPEEPPCVPEEDPFGGVFLAFLMKQEGFRAYPYKSVEGNKDPTKKSNPTVGFGHKLTDDEVASGAFNEGLSEEEAIALLIQDIQVRVPQAIQVYNNAHGQGAFDSAPLWGKRMLVDKVFQSGAGGLAKFVKMMKAIADEDKDTASDEMLTFYYNIHGKPVYDYGRRDRFIKYVLNSCE